MRRLVMGIAGALIAGSLSLAPSPAHAETTICTAKSVDELLECEPGWAVNINFMHWRMYRGHNCTNYVAWRLIRDGVKEPNYLLGNAEDWADRAEDHGVPVNSTPAVGAVGGWPGRNHLVYVEKIGNGWMQLAEDSWSQKRFRRYIAYRGDRGYPTEFIHFPGGVRGSTPTVTGTPHVGQTLKANAGSWSPQGVRLTYTWLRDGVVIPGATFTSHRLVGADAGKRITVAVTGSYGDMPSRTASSEPTAPIAPGTISPGTPTVSGWPVVGETLAADPGTWQPSTGLRYKWYADGDRIAGATERTFRVSADQLGKRITVRVTGRPVGYTAVMRASTPTLKVVRRGEALDRVVAGEAQLSAPRTMVVGDQLQVRPGTWSPDSTSVTVRWLRQGTPIPGETATTYTLRPADIGKRIIAEVTGRRRHFEPARVWAPAPDVVHPRVLRPAAAPSIAGSGLVGEKLVLNPGTWIPGGTTPTVQWTRGGQNIPGATGAAYTVSKDDLRHALGVRLTTRLAGWPDDQRTVTSSIEPRAVSKIVAQVRPSGVANSVRLTLSAQAVGDLQHGTIQLQHRGRIVKSVRVSAERPVATLFEGPPGNYTVKLTFRGAAWVTTATEQLTFTIR